MEQAVEARLIICWVDFIIEKGATHVSKHYDGLRVDKVRCSLEEPVQLPGPMDSQLSGVQALCVRSSKYLKEQTGFDVRIRLKEHKTIIELFDVFAKSKESSDWRSVLLGEIAEDHIIMYISVHIMIVLCIISVHIINMHIAVYRFCVINGTCLF